jgi:hypothetical protein
MDQKQSYLTEEEFIQRFKLNHKLARSDPKAMKSWESYTITIRKLRSESVQYLRSLGMPGYLRSEYNELLQTFAKYGHREYLYFKDPTCKICTYPIAKLEDSTIDHIIPSSKGGENALYNKQIAHDHCNVKKADKITI